MIYNSWPDKKYDIIIADPPWHYYGATDKMGAAGKEYDILSDDEILQLNIDEILEDNGIVFLWATCPRLDFAIDCLKSWGLHFRGVQFVWVKTSIDGTPLSAIGVRPSIVKPLTEFVIAGSRVKRGRPMQIHSEKIVQTIFSARGKHSQKPNEVLDRINELYPNASKIELFARREYQGYDAFGDEL